MKKQDISKLHQATKKELESKLEELQKQLVQERMNIKLGNQKNTSITTNIRRDIARVKTILKNQDIAPKNKDKKGK
jgi:large subunit ribosomal protein L29